MRKILSFKCPEEESEFTFANHGSYYHSVIQDLANELRRITKYESDQHSDDYIRGIEFARDKLWELTRMHEVGDDF